MNESRWSKYFHLYMNAGRRLRSIEDGSRFLRNGLSVVGKLVDLVGPLLNHQGIPVRSLIFCGTSPKF